MKKEIVPVIIATLFFAGSSLKAGNTKTELDNIGNRRISRRSVIPESLEARMGKVAAARLERSSPMVQDQDLNAYVNRVAQKVAANSDLKSAVSAKIIDSPDFDAVSLPGGFLYVTTGLLKNLDSEDQLAAALAHEIAHLAARHAASRLTRRVAANAVGFLPFGTTYAIAVAAPQSSLPLALAKFSRGQELEADFLGVQYLYKSGYDPNALVSLLRKAAEIEKNTARKPSRMQRVLANHPRSEERIEKAQQEISELLPKRQYTIALNSEFENVRQRLRASRNASGDGRISETIIENAGSKIEEPSTRIASEQNPAPIADEQVIDFTPPVLERNDPGTGAAQK